jgi:hypothetical protein
MLPLAPPPILKSGPVPEGYQFKLYVSDIEIIFESVYWLPSIP